MCHHRNTVLVLVLLLNLIASLDASPIKRKRILSALLKGHSQEDENKENKAEGTPFHLFPPFVSELGEIGLFILDVVWHHDIVHHIEQVGDQVAEINGKVDAVLSILQQQQRPFVRSDSSPNEIPDEEEQVNNDTAGDGSIVGRLITWALGTSVFGVAQWLAPRLG